MSIAPFAATVKRHQVAGAFSTKFVTDARQPNTPGQHNRMRSPPPADSWRGEDRPLIRAGLDADIRSLIVQS